jgi:glucokinase
MFGCLIFDNRNGAYMSVIGVDLGGTKLAAAVFNDDASIATRITVPLEGRSGSAVGRLLTGEIDKLLKETVKAKFPITGIGISIPGIYFAGTGCVWAPNIPDWKNYPLLEEVRSAMEGWDISVNIDSDRACYILGETWQGVAKGSSNAVFLAVGTGIGAGILCDGRIIRGHGDIAGAVGWMGLQRPFRDAYKPCGCFEYHASGEGIVKVTREMLIKEKEYSGYLGTLDLDRITTRDIFAAYDEGDRIARFALDEAVVIWGMAAANIVSTFNPEIIVLGGGVFGPAVRFIDRIRDEARKWAQPISMQQVRIEASTLGGDAGLLGAGKLALRG